MDTSIKKKPAFIFQNVIVKKRNPEKLKHAGTGKQNSSRLEFISNTLAIFQVEVLFFIETGVLFRDGFLN